MVSLITCYNPSHVLSQEGAKPSLSTFTFVARFDILDMIYAPYNTGAKPTFHAAAACRLPVRDTTYVGQAKCVASTWSWAPVVDR